MHGWWRLYVLICGICTEEGNSIEYILLQPALWWFIKNYLPLSFSASLITWWLVDPSMWTMKPTPQASFSCAGSYKPSAWWINSINFSITPFNSITIFPAPGCPNPLDGRSWLSQFFFRRYFLVLTSGSLQLVSSKGIISCSHQMSQKEQIVLKYC